MTGPLLASGSGLSPFPSPLAGEGQGERGRSKARQTLRRAQPRLGTLVRIDVVPCANVDVAAAFAAAFAAIARVERAMSPHLPSSDVARFNAAPAGAVLDCDPWTLAVLRWARRLHTATQGAFDITLGSGGATALRIRDRRTLEKRAPSRLDLGGIAKGYAVDRAVATLRAHGVRAGLVNAGGDLRAFGRHPWPVVARGVDGATASMTMALERGALATSAWRNGRSPHKHDPLIAPAHGGAVAIDRAVTVAAPRCVVADALTKVVALTGDCAHRAVVEQGACAWLH